MCGINVFLDKKRQYESTVISRMNEALYHRGPDHSGFASFAIRNGMLYLGNTRLRIRERTSRADQPLQAEPYCLTYNGEIYNPRELYNPPESSDSDLSDTLTLFHFLARQGVWKLDQINGMYAFAWYDQQKEKLWLARDPQGIKPLYFYEDEHIFLASSEIRAILASGLVTKQLNEGQIRHYLQFKYARRPETFFQNIFELEPGSVWEVFSGNEYQSEHTFTDMDLEDPVPLLQASLDHAVQSQMIADVPVGVMFSGGIDSSLLLAVLQRYGHTEIPTYSISADPKELEAASHAARKYNSVHNSLFLGPEHASEWPAFIKDLDQPVGDSAAFLTYMLSQTAGRDVGVLLSGAGADEFFAGYNRHDAFNLYLKSPALYSNPVFKAGLHAWASLVSAQRQRLLRKFIRDTKRSPSATYTGYVSVYAGDENVLSIQTLEDALDHDRTQYLVLDVLAITDRMSMAHSMEVRVPFLDRNLVMLARSIPADKLLLNGRKWILKEYLSCLEKNKVIDAPKRGFGIDADSSFTFKLLDMIGPGLKKNDFIYRFLDPHTAELLRKDPLRLDVSLFWNLVILVSWLDDHFG